MNESSAIKCPLCGGEYSHQRFVCHLTRSHKLSRKDELKMYCELVFGADETNRLVEEYKKGKICAYDLTSKGWKYQHIVDYIKELGLKRTSSEERHTDRYKTRYMSSIQKKYGEGITNVSQVKEVQKKKEQTFADKYGSYEEYCSCARKRMVAGCKKKWRTDSAYREKMSEQMRGENNVSRRAEVAKKIAETKAKKYAEMTHEEKCKVIEKARKAMPRGKLTERISRVEKRVWDALSYIGIEFEHNKKMFGYNVDILCIRQKIIIEVNGDYFHANPSLYDACKVMFKSKNGKMITAREIWERDARKKESIETANYKLFVLWESDIRKCKTKESLCELIKSKVKIG